MPRATVNTEDTIRKDLKTAPPDGFVVLKRMSFGEVVQRRTMTKLSVEAGGGKSKDFRGELAMASEQVTRFEFAHSVVDHNLEDHTGRKLNLAAPVDFATLDPRIGQEIEELISELNGLDEDAEDPQES
jgi:hypothetical protein